MNQRTRLPDRRRCETVEFVHTGFLFTVATGQFHDGRLAEIFISPVRRVGSPIEAIARDAAIVTSIALQCGADLDVIRNALTKDHDGGPATLLGAALDALASPAMHG